MWALKIMAKEKEGPYSWRTEKFNVKLYYYALNNYYEKGKYYFTSTGLVEGSQQNVNAFMKSLSKDKKTSHFEKNKNSFVYIYSEDEKSERIPAVKLAYNPKFFFLKPAYVDEKGFEHWEIACAERKELDAIIKLAHVWKKTEFKLHHLKKQKFESVMLFSTHPNLTDRQKKALDLAIENGYYGYPRKIKLEKLAQMMKISLSTYQFHLAKAEEKVLPKLKEM